MASFVRLLSPTYSSPFISPHRDNNISSSQLCRAFACNKTRFSIHKVQLCDDQNFHLTKDTNNLSLKEFQIDELVRPIHCMEDYERGLLASKEKLVIAHFSTSDDNQYDRKVQQFVDANYRGVNMVKFLHVMVDESEKTGEICSRENIEKIPCLVFYRNRRKVHEETGFQPEKLINSIKYHTNDHSFTNVVQLHERDDFEGLVKNVGSNKLIVLNVGMRQCMPCVKIYPTMVTLANQMASKAVFARINADESESCMQICKDMDVAKVPTFLFFKNGDLCGRYVGSCSSKLIREIEKL